MFLIVTTNIVNLILVILILIQRKQIFNILVEFVSFIIDFLR